MRPKAKTYVPPIHEGRKGVVCKEEKMTPKPRREAEVKSSVMATLKSLGCLAFRMNSGRMMGQHRGKTWSVQLAPSGTADILAFVGPQPLWIECKRPGGKLSREQLQFRVIVQDMGHEWIVADNAETVACAVAALRGKV